MNFKPVDECHEDGLYIDNWHDIAGYATLVEQELNMTNHDKEQSQ